MLGPCGITTQIITIIIFTAMKTSKSHQSSALKTKTKSVTSAVLSINFLFD
jgi:hypothetical protein